MYGSKTGFDGSGTSDRSFVSKSGRVIIQMEDFMFAKIKAVFKNVTKPGFEATWKVEPLFVDIYKSPIIEDEKVVYKTTIVQGLTNSAHTLEIVPIGDGLVPIEAIEVHQPPLK